MLMETGKKIFCLSLDTGKQSGTFRPLYNHDHTHTNISTDRYDSINDIKQQSWLALQQLYSTTSTCACRL